MTELFGKKDAFAIQAQVAYLTDSGSPVGSICLWIAEQEIGDYDSIEVLGYCDAGFYNLIKDTGNRKDPLIDGKPKEEVASFIHAAVFGELRDRSENGLEFEERFQKFVLCPELGEAFEKEFVIVLDDDSQSRLIWVDHGTGRANETTVLQSDIKTAAQSFSAWLKSFYE